MIPKPSSKERLAELCDIWYDMPVEAKASTTRDVAWRIYQKLSKAKKAFVVVMSLVASAMLIYISSGNWAFAFLLGALVMLVVIWTIAR